MMAAVDISSVTVTWTPPSESEWNVASSPEEMTALEVTFTVLMSICILTTIVGNILVVLSVFTYKPLRSVQNFYIVSLAVADLAVAVFVMPFNVANFLAGQWEFGETWCNMWLTFDVLMCTASILNLCAIAVDRYYAIHDPINYAQKRTLVRVMIGILIIWTASSIISIPPLFGWNNSGDSSTSLYNSVNRTCQLTDERGYVIYSASGSFYIPLVVMAFVYVNIFMATRARLRARAANGLPGGGRTVRGVSRWRSSWRNPLPVAETQYNTAAANELQRDVINSPVNNHSNGVKNNGDVIANTSQNIKVSGEVDTSSMIESSSTSRGNSASEPPGKHPPMKMVESFLRHSRRAKRPTSLTGSRVVGTTPTTGNYLTVNHLQTAADDRSPDSSVRSTQMSQFLEEKQRISLSKERRAARTMGIIMGAFVLCWLPFFLMYVIFPFCKTCKETTDPRIVNFIVWLGYINSTINPIIYTVFNVDFRRAFALLLQGNCRTHYRPERRHLTSTASKSYESRSVIRNNFAR